jgi:hypothetical protein
VICEASIAVYAGIMKGRLTDNHSCNPVSLPGPTQPTDGLPRLDNFEHSRARILAFIHSVNLVYVLAISVECGHM